MSKAMTNMSLFAIALVINKSISLIMLPVLPQYLTPEQMGKLELLTSIGVVTALLTSMAMHEALYRFVSVERDDAKKADILNQIYSLSVSIIAVIGLVLILLILVAPIPSPFSEFEFIALVLAIILEGPISIGTAWLRMQDDKAKTLLYVMITTTLLQAVFIVAALLIHPHVISVLFGGLLAAVVQFIWLHIVNKYNLVLPDFMVAKEHLSYSTPVMMSALVAFCLNGAERWFIGANASLATLGIYAIAVKFAIGMCILVQPFGMWWMPRRFSYLERRCGAEAVRISHFGMIYIAALTVLVATLAFVVINYFLPHTYHQAALYTLFLLPIAMLREWCELLNIAILYKRRTRWLLGMNVIAAGIAITLLFALSPLGVYGVFIALYYAQLAKLIMTLVIGQQCMFLPFHLSLMVVLQIISGSALLLIHSSESVGSAVVICILTCVIFAGIACKFIPKCTRVDIIYKIRAEAKRVTL